MSDGRRIKSQLEAYVSEHQDELSAWNSFIEKYKADLLVQAMVHMKKQYTGSAECPPENGKKCDDLWKLAVSSLKGWENNAKNFDPEGYVLPLEKDPAYVGELIALPRIDPEFGFLESLLKKTLPYALELDRLSGKIFGKRPVSCEEKVFFNGGLASYFGDEIVRAYADRYFMGEIYAKWDASSKEEKGDLVKRAREKTDAYNDIRKASYPKPLSEGMGPYFSTEGEAELCRTATHNLRTYEGRYIEIKLWEYEEELK